MIRYIDVVLNVPLNQAFTYKDVQNQEEYLTPEKNFGRRVQVRFGGRVLTGIVIDTYEGLKNNCAVTEDKIRFATKYIDKEAIFTKELYDIAKFMSDYYIAPIGECVSTMIPSGKREVSAGSFSFQEDEKSFKKKELSEEQKSAVEGIMNADDGKLFHYLYGSTGSGKTEVFLTCAEKVLEKGKSVIYLVPEIGLTPQVIEAVVERFGNTAAVLHSGLTPSQKLSEWKRILKGEAKIIVGARSACFAPTDSLGLIIIDEEHDSSYKSGSSPRYHARQIAMKRCSSHKIPLLMGSATPSVEAWHSMNNGSIKKHILTKRLAGGAVPQIKAINLSLEKNNDSSISRELEEEINKTLAEKKQTILFLNRMGFTHFFRCFSCGYELKCKNCSVSMTYHKSQNRLKCHYCGYNIQPPQQCPECSSLDVGYSGFGTEFIESEVKAKFPQARTIRIDTDNIANSKELKEKLEKFMNGEYDIMLGTQMVAKGLNFPNLKLVGVILADTSLHMPDFRASEKTFSLITQVAGRAGRFFPDGKVLVQSYSPDREPIAKAVNNKIEEFYENELKQRQALGFPPYTRLLRLVFRSQVPQSAYLAAENAMHILEKNALNDVELLGPAECPVSKVNNSYRHQILMRSLSVKSMIESAKKLIWGYKCPNNVYIEVDVDPVSLL